MRVDWLADADARSPWSQATVVVAGLSSGFPVADALTEFGATVWVLDDAATDANRERATLLEALGAKVVLGPGSTGTLPRIGNARSGIDLVITSPGWPPRHPLLVEAVHRGIPIWGDMELAWRLSRPDKVIPWIGVTGTNGKTTTVQMLESMLRAGGFRTAAFGNIGRPIMEFVLDPDPLDVIVVELSSFQLHWTHSLSMHSAAVLNLHPDHLEWYPDMAGYTADKAKIYQRAQYACVYNVDEPVTEQMVEQADVVEGCRAIGFTLGVPSPSMVGVVDDYLVDRAFIAARRSNAQELASLSDVQPYAPHNVANALAAATLARSFGVSPAAVRDGLRALTLGGHRIATVAMIDGVRWVDDSKATNPHAAAASLQAFESVVWIAGGQAKGTSFDDLVTAVAARLRGVVILGVDRQLVADALTRHAPDVPMIRVDSNETSAMAQAVTAAASLARPGDAVLLAPGCASKDMFIDYAARGDAFVEAVEKLRRGNEDRRS